MEQYQKLSCMKSKMQQATKDGEWQYSLLLSGYRYRHKLDVMNADSFVNGKPPAMSSSTLGKQCELCFAFAVLHSGPSPFAFLTRFD